MGKAEKVEVLHQRLAEQVDALVSGEDWAAMLAVAGRFHRYSANNVFLIMAQRPDATRVAGYRAWKALGRQVRKGERGIAILAPCVYRRRALEEHEVGERPELARVLRGFTVVHVFDVSQTEGAELADVTPELLEGEGPAGLWAALAALVADAGFTVERGECGGANGSTDFDGRVVRVRADVDEAQAVKTLAHELGHVRLHDASRITTDRDLAEVEAESVAFIVCAAAGLASTGYSLPYVARWAGGDIAKVRTTAERVITTARDILTVLDLDRHRANGEGEAAA